jgi:hypothetical protein
VTIMGAILRTLFHRESPGGHNHVVTDYIASSGRVSAAADRLASTVNDDDGPLGALARDMRGAPPRKRSGTSSRKGRGK